MSKLPDVIDMFPKPESGFSKSYLREFRKIFEERVTQIRNTLSRDPGFMDLSTSDYKEIRTYLKKEVEQIGQYYFHLINEQDKFNDKQLLKVHEICGSKPSSSGKKLEAFVNACNFNKDVNRSTQEFLDHYYQSLNEIDHMVSFDDLDESLYNDYKIKLVDHLDAMDAQDMISVNLIIQQHFDDNTTAVLGNLRGKWDLQKSAIEKKLTEVEHYYQDILVEIEDKKDKLEVMKLKFFNPDTIVTSKENLIQEVNNLEIQKTRVKHNRYYSEWKDAMHSLNETSKKIYETYVSLYSIWVNSPVDPTEAKKPRLSLEVEEQFNSWTSKLHAIIKKCIKLAREETDTKEKINYLDED